MDGSRMDHGDDYEQLVMNKWWLLLLLQVGLMINNADGAMLADPGPHLMIFDFIFPS